MTSIGQRKRAQHLDQLAVVADAHELVARGGDDLLAGKRAAATLDELQIVIGLVGAVHVDREFACLVEVQHRYAVALEALGAGDRTGDRAVDLALDACQGIDEVVGRRAGADTNDGAALHVFQGRLGNLFFQFVLVHACLLGFVLAHYSHATHGRHGNTLYAGPRLTRQRRCAGPAGTAVGCH